MWDYIWFWISAEIAKAIMAFSFISLLVVGYVIYVLISVVLRRAALKESE